MERVESWKDVPDKVVDKFVRNALELQRELVPVDCDSAFTVELIFVDRRIYERIHFFPVPYRGKNDTDDEAREEALLTNVKIAIEALDTELRINKNRRRREREGPTGQEG